MPASLIRQKGNARNSLLKLQLQVVGHGSLQDSSKAFSWAASSSHRHGHGVSADE